EPDDDELRDLGLEHGHGLTLFGAKGCVACAGTGYAGRIALYEVMNVHGRIRRHIEATTEEIFAAAVEDGMTTLRQDGIRIVLEAAAERVVGIVVRRREVEHRAELALRLAPAVDAEVRDAERLADGRLVRLASLRLLERDRRLRGAAVLQVRLALLEKLVGLAHGR